MTKYEIVKLIGGWGVKVEGAELPISVHYTQREAERAVKLYKATDKGRNR